MRTSSDHHLIQFGDATIKTMTSNEPLIPAMSLTGIQLPGEAVEVLSCGNAIRVLAGGGVEIVEGEPAGLILFGRLKGDRPSLDGFGSDI